MFVSIELQGMKKLILVITLLITYLTSGAQTDSVRVWNKWCSKRDTLVLYNGANNMIQVYSPTLKPNEIKLKSLDASLRIGEPEVKGDTVSVLAMPYPKKGKHMRLAVMYRKNGRVIKTVEFVSENVPPLVARIGVLARNEAARKDILSQTTLKLSFPGSYYCYPYTIRQYTFKIQHEKGGATLPVNGFFLTKEVLQQIKDAPAGTVAEFTNIKVTCPECATRTLEDIKVRIR